MSLEIEELRSQIIRRFKKRLSALGIDRVDLIKENDVLPQSLPQTAPMPVVKKTFSKRLSTTLLIRICEVALLVSVLPTIFPNFKLNYAKPCQATIACVQAVGSPFSGKATADETLWNQLSPHATEMAVSQSHPVPSHPLPSPLVLHEESRRPRRCRSQQARSVS